MYLNHHKKNLPQRRGWRKGVQRFLIFAAFSAPPAPLPETVFSSLHLKLNHYQSLASLKAKATDLAQKVIRLVRLKDETGGGTLYDIGIYCLNAARHPFRAEPLEVTAYFDDARHVVDINITGASYLIRKVGREMRERGQGRRHRVTTITLTRR